MHDQFTERRIKRLSRAQPLRWRLALLPFQMIYGAYLLVRIWLLLEDNK